MRPFITHQHNQDGKCFQERIDDVENSGIGEREVVALTLSGRIKPEEVAALQRLFEVKGKRSFSKKEEELWQRKSTG
jgi:hypothetical protein